MSFLITAILGVILAGVGGVLVVSLSGPLNSLKDMFIAFINLICNNAIWFIFFILLFVIVVSILKKIKPFEFKSMRQQHFENNLQKQNVELNKSKLEFEKSKAFSDQYYRGVEQEAEHQHRFALEDLKRREMTLREKKFKEEKKKNNDWRKLSKWKMQNHLI